MSNPSHRFKLRLWPTLATLVGLSMLLALGNWQWHRYRQKKAMEIRRKAQTGLPVINADSLQQFEAQRVDYRKVRLKGHIDNRYKFLIEHRFHEGKPGYWLVSPLIFNKGGGAVLVNRGWIPFEQGQQIARHIKAEPLDLYQGKVQELQSNIADTDVRKKIAAGKVDVAKTMTLWTSYDVVEMQKVLPFHMPKRPDIVALNPTYSGSPYPIASITDTTEPYLTSRRHLGYCLTWYLLAACLFGMYVAYSFGYLESGEFIDIAERETAGQGA